MGWFKDAVEENTGAQITYWEVMSGELQMQSPHNSLSVGGWASKEAHDSGKAPLKTITKVIPSGTFRKSERHLLRPQVSILWACLNLKARS